jgi:hypothetical protein
MKKPEEKPESKKKVNKPDKKEKASKSVRSSPEDERTGFGILPDRDLKKNLGCG